MGEGRSEEKATPHWKKNLEQLYPKEIYGDEELFNEDGVDLTLVRKFLGMTPEERLSVAEELTEFVLEVHAAKGNI